MRRWLLEHPRFHVHFTPTGASWLNLVERFFVELTEKQLRRGVHRSVRELEEAIIAHIEAHNTAGKAFVWTKSADEILVTPGPVLVCARVGNGDPRALPASVSSGRKTPFLPPVPSARQHRPFHLPALLRRSTSKGRSMEPLLASLFSFYVFSTRRRLFAMSGNR